MFAWATYLYVVCATASESLPVPVNPAPAIFLRGRGSVHTRFLPILIAGLPAVVYHNLVPQLMLPGQDTSRMICSLWLFI